jgi:hypothetical protein
MEKNVPLAQTHHRACGGVTDAAALRDRVLPEARAAAWRRAAVSRLAWHRFFRDAPAVAAIAVHVEADEFRMRCDVGEAHLRAACGALRWIDIALWIARAER